MESYSLVGTIIHIEMLSRKVTVAYVCTRKQRRRAIAIRPFSEEDESTHKRTWWLSGVILAVLYICRRASVRLALYQVDIAAPLSTI